MLSSLPKATQLVSRKTQTGTPKASGLSLVAASHTAVPPCLLLPPQKTSPILLPPFSKPSPLNPFPASFPSLFSQKFLRN